ncbi:MAG: hypothetical protein ABEI78_02415 [Candidatus Nanohaloarchaea archaeon]
MNKEETLEELNEYKDGKSRQDLIKLLINKLSKELEEYPVSSDKQKHELNMMIRNIEEELDWIESKKLAEFDPEQE